MPYLLNALYLLLLVVSSPWLLASALRKGKYRSGWRQKFLGLVSPRAGDKPCVWLHAVSLGEVSLIGPLVAEIERRHPDWQIAISTTTLTGHEAAMKRYARHAVFYCPLDFSWAVRRAMRRVRPQLLVLAELELWPNLIRAAHEIGGKVAIANGRLSEHSFRGYARFRPLVAHVLRQVDRIAAQTPVYAERFRQLGARADAVHVSGSLKFDGAETNRDNPATQRLRELAGFAADDIVFLAGSTQEPEERLALEAFQQLSAEHPRLKLVLVPRHPDRFEEVARLLDASGLGWQRRTALNKRGRETLFREDGRILLVDTVGELGAWWGTASIAYVGGSMGPRNGQNMIEPAAYGAAVSFGPKTKNFRDVVEALLSAQAAVVVQTGEQLTTFVRRCLADSSYARELGNNAQRVVASQLGATARTADLLDALLQPASDGARRAAA